MRCRLWILAAVAGSLLANAGQAENVSAVATPAAAPAATAATNTPTAAAPNASTAAAANATPAPAVPAAPPAPRKVILILVDGVRQRELLGNATDDNGNPVRASTLLPNITALRKSGVFFSRMRISNPAGVSLPAYADIFAGRRQERIVTNTPSSADFRSHYPTLFQAVKKDLGLGFDGVMLIAAWSPLCPVAVLPPVAPADDFYRSCGFRNNAAPAAVASPNGNSGGPGNNLPPPPPPTVQPSPPSLPGGVQPANPIYFKPEIYGGSRADSDTFLEAMVELPRRHPRLAVVHFVDADEEAHLQLRVQRRINQNYGIFHYHQALRATDYYIGRLWAMLQADPFYQGSTYLLISTDHGRDDFPEAEQWAQHGHCVSEFGSRKTCSGCSRIFTIAVGPGVAPRVVKKVYDHTSLGPTMARLIGASFGSATGDVMDELFK
jgi:hypothetical protein